MVKGISKQVIVVKAPISSMFDQAIFILKENTLSTDNTIDSENILREACAVADDYVRSHCGTVRKGRKKAFPAVLIGGALLLVAIGLVVFISL